MISNSVFSLNRCFGFDNYVGANVDKFGWQAQVSSRLFEQTGALCLTHSISCRVINGPAHTLDNQSSKLGLAYTLDQLSSEWTASSEWFSTYIDFNSF